jgi:glycosyltransferase involved in cell wall biosynthesis
LQPTDYCLLYDHSHPQAITPALTVIITVFNYQDYLPECLDSVKEQTLANLDLVVVDDASTDNSVEVALNWLKIHADRFASCRLARQRSNGGPGRARNLAFQLVRTEFVFVLDADNLIYPRCLQRLTEALDHCDADFAHCYLEKFGAETGLVGPIPWWEPGTFQYGNRIDAMCLMRLAAWMQVGGYSEERALDGWEDFDLWFRIARQAGWGILVPEILARYRTHDRSLLRRATNCRIHKLWSYLRVQYPEFFTGDCAPDAYQLYEAMRDSWSWRLTAPLRLFGRSARFSIACLTKLPRLSQIVRDGLRSQWMATKRLWRNRGSKPSWVARSTLPTKHSMTVPDRSV